jgi:hypothetical protein
LTESKGVTQRSKGEKSVGKVYGGVPAYKKGGGGGEEYAMAPHVKKMVTRASGV